MNKIHKIFAVALFLFALLMGLFSIAVFKWYQYETFYSHSLDMLVEKEQEINALRYQVGYLCIGDADKENLSLGEYQDITYCILIHLNLTPKMSEIIFGLTFPE